MDLSTQDRESLRFLVAEDARRKASPEASAELRKEENLQLWSDFLHELNKDLESQFMERKADAQAFQNACFNAGPEGNANGLNTRLSTTSGARAPDASKLASSRESEKTGR